jgi:DNA replication protein DnaC
VISLREAIDSAQAAIFRRQAEEAESAGLTVDQLEAVRLEAEKTEKRRAAILRSGILVTATDVDLIARSQFQWTAAAEWVRRWAANSEARPILVLCGSVGRGKTFAAAVGIASAGRGIAIKAPELAARVSPMPTELERRVDLRQQLLVLDDLGAEADPRNARWSDSFFRFVESRALYGRTIITSNLLRVQFRDRYDPRVIDRLNSNARAIEVTGESMRKGGGGL